MQLVIVAVGSRMPAWVDAAFGDYASRMPPECRIVLREVRPESRTAGKTVDAMMAAEAERIRAALPKRGPRIVLDERGRDATSQAFADALAGWRDSGDDAAFVIGGPDGLARELKDEATSSLRLSSLTLPHGLARVVLAEQLYRAWSIARNHPYHRA